MLEKNVQPIIGSGFWPLILRNILNILKNITLQYMRLEFQIP